MPTQHPNVIAPIPFTPTRFMVVTCQARMEPDREWFETEGCAVEVARARVGANVGQATVEAWSGNPETFGVRHFVFDQGVVSDSGWRCWVDGVFVGAGVEVKA